MERPRRIIRKPSNYLEFITPSEYEQDDRDFIIGSSLDKPHNIVKESPDSSNNTVRVSSTCTVGVRNGALGDINGAVGVSNDAYEVSSSAIGSSDVTVGVRTATVNHPRIINDHIQAVETKLYSCDRCNLKCISKGALMRHSQKHKDAGGGKLFQCSECGKQLSSQHALNEHVNIHAKHRPHKCETCGYESCHLSVYLRHLVTHEERQMFSCSTCAKTFKQNQYLQQHLRKHTGEKPCVCGLCGKRFTCKSELNRHKKRHTADRPHLCAECGKCFKMQHNLKAHIKLHCADQSWKCITCHAVFTQQKMYELHKRTHNDGVEQLQVTRPRENLLLVSASGCDKRKLPTFHSVPIPSDAISTQDHTTKCNKYLRINDTVIPLQMLLESCGKGNSLQIKIIDQTKSSKLEDTTVPVIEIIDDGVKEEQKDQHLKETPIDKITEEVVQSNNEEMEFCENEEPLHITSVLTTSESIVSHCSSAFIHQIFHPEYTTWIATLMSLSRQLVPPFEQEVCEQLSCVISTLQDRFLSYSEKLNNATNVKTELQNYQKFKQMENCGSQTPIGHSPNDGHFQENLKVKTAKCNSKDFNKNFSNSKKRFKSAQLYMSSIYKDYLELNSILQSHWKHIFKL